MNSKRIEKIEDIDWNEMWNRTLQEMPSKNTEKRWDKIASKFNEWMKTDDYPQNFADKIHKESDYTVLDLGCGNGSITLKVAEEVEHEFKTRCRYRYHSYFSYNRWIICQWSFNKQ